ncbi:phosphonate ABC transporter, permease protein PhnE [Chachezhania sediminis]|uniref:phosphonate ABC transporter, permease protein PhnE n=1 Tax=Chachezhania sediminis TaxID=2599291 RepID=UPI00131BECBF|nr:phosphonate ABC transporter, permease protein PhnE [Chachezhania sediminis]
MTVTTSDIDLLKAGADHLFRTKRLMGFAVPAVAILYLAYIFFAFDVAGLWSRADVEKAHTLISDSYSYKMHVTRDNRTGQVDVSIEGRRNGTYDADKAPDWVARGTETVIDLGRDNIVTFGPGSRVTYAIPGYGTFTADPGRNGVNATYPPGELPGWINASRNRVAITTEAGRLTVTRNRTEVFRYFLGWEAFWFTIDSPYYGMNVIDVASHAVRGEAGDIWTAFWTNTMWRHQDVAWALFETILMAFLGTFGAGIVALPLAFLAARNFSPFLAVRFTMRRAFDFVRGVDALIWTIVLARAFGPGPLTGALAILVTDTGTFGKIFSEALENVDKAPIEGVTSTGANAVQRYRFGVIPQVVPVLISQLLYFLESNTRSATVIGAITGGGIGLLITQAIITQQDWEKVTYFIVLIVLLVMAMDSLSGWLRRRLIAGGDSGP